MSAKVHAAKPTATIKARNVRLPKVPSYVRSQKRQRRNTTTAAFARYRYLHQIKVAGGSGFIPRPAPRTLPTNSFRPVVKCAGCLSTPCWCTEAAGSPRVFKKRQTLCVSNTRMKRTVQENAFWRIGQSNSRLLHHVWHVASRGHRTRQATPTDLEGAGSNIGMVPSKLKFPLSGVPGTFVSRLRFNALRSNTCGGGTG